MATSPPAAAADPLLDEACILDMDHFVTALAAVQDKGIRPDLLGSIISHYACKWLPELSAFDSGPGASAATPSRQNSTATWLRKRFLVETLAGMLPAERDAVPCGFLLRLLRAASMVGADPSCVGELEARAAAQLDQAALKDIMIPAFSHLSGTLLDVGMVVRLVRRFAGAAAAAKKVAALVDCYLAEVAMDAGLTVAEFEELAGAIPAHARASDDGLYQAIDLYIKAHPATSKQDRKVLFTLLDPRKLSPEAATHAAQNDRLPVRSIIHVLFNSNTNAAVEGSAGTLTRTPSSAFEASGRMASKREAQGQNEEMRRLRDDVARLKLQCHALQMQIDRVTATSTSTPTPEEKKKKKKGLFGWTSFALRGGDLVEKMEVGVAGPQTPAVDVKKGRLHGRSVTQGWRNSMS